ncbi:MAG: YceI family protein [Polyangiaceae bacterium]
MTQQTVETGSSSNQWDVDAAHTGAHFSVRHMMVSNVRGEIHVSGGSLTYDPAKPEASKLDVTIDVKTIDTREAKRDEHLKSADFFDAEKFPTITFKSKSVKKDGKKLDVTGDLTIHGVTKEVVLHVDELHGPAKDPWGGTRIGATGATKINRKDFGLGWNVALETGGILVGEEISITIEAEFTQKK